MKDYIELISSFAVIITATVAVLQYISLRKVKRKNRSLQEKVDLIASTGLAIGYYYNFVVNVFSKLREHKLTIQVYKDNTSETEKIQEFLTDDVELHIIMPSDLQVKSLNNSLKKMRIHRKGNIISSGSERDFGINFMYTEENKIAILDFPKPLNAMREYLKKNPKYAVLLETSGKLRESREWKEHEQRELENFKETITQLMDMGRIDEGQTETKFVNAEDVPMSADGL